MQIKLEAVLPERSRIARAKARDLYDCAWIARNRPETLATDNLHALRAIGTESEKEQRMLRWREDFEHDPIMRRVPITTVLEVLRSAVANELTRREGITARSEEPTPRQEIPAARKTATEETANAASARESDAQQDTE